MLELKQVSVRFGKATALEDISVTVGRQEVVSIIGANGAGKTTVLRAISRLKSIHSGEIVFNGRRIDRSEPLELVRQGIIHIPEGRRLFPYMSVLDNLKLGASLRRDKKEIASDLEKVLERFPRLGERFNQLAGNMSGGEQQMLAIGRGLMAKPVILMLDEPSVGLSPLMVAEVSNIIKDINQKGVAVLLVEQNISLAFDVSSRGYVLQAGKLVFEGTTAELNSGDTVTQAYFGGE